MFFAGLDWARHIHAMCVIDPAGAVRDRFEITHDRDGLAELMRRLACFGTSVRIAIERPSGLIVDALVEAGHEVFPIHPNAVKASRPRYRSHGGKSDASDAYLLADLLRTDGHRWTALSPQSDSIRALRALVRARDDLVHTRVAAGQPVAQHAGGLLAGRRKHLLPTSPRLSALAFLRRYPSPASAARLTKAALARFCRTQHYSGQRTPAELLARLQSAAVRAHGRTSPQQRWPRWSRVGRPCSSRWSNRFAALTRRIERFVESLPDGQIIMSFPRAGRVCAAQILAELGDVRERYPTLDRLTAEAGVVPLTCQSGKSRNVGFRWACNHRFRHAITTLADNSRHANDWARSIYAPHAPAAVTIPMQFGSWPALGCA